MHIVTVPRSGAPRTTLVNRFAAVVGFDPEKLTAEPAWDNETVGVAGTEVIRRVNVRMDGRLSEPAYARTVKGVLVPMLAQRTEPVRFTLPAEDVSWVSERADALIEQVKARGFPVSGDLEELRVVPAPGRRPDDATADELLEVALDGLALMTEKYATSWWVRRRSAIEANFAPDRRWSARARGAWYDATRWGTSVAAGESRTGGVLRATGRALRWPARAGAVLRSRNRSVDGDRSNPHSRPTRSDRR
jgi:hypothetical protein